MKKERINQIKMRQMKNKKILTLLAISLVAMGTIHEALAQDQTVYTGSSYNYSTTQSVTSGTSSFTWNVTGGTNGTDFNFNPADNDSSINISWINSGSYTVEVTEVSSNGCTNPSAPMQYVVNCITPATIQFASTSSANCSGAAGTDLDLTLEFTGTAVYPIVVNYNVDGTPHSRTLNSGTTISLGSEDDILVNNTASDVTKVIVITSATSGGANLSIGTNDTYYYTVYATPQLNPITHD